MTSRSTEMVGTYGCIRKVLERLHMRREAHMLEDVFFKRTSDGEPVWNYSYRYAILYAEYMSMKSL